MGIATVKGSMAREKKKHSRYTGNGSRKQTLEADKDQERHIIHDAKNVETDKNGEYLFHLDGLRMIALLGVLLFHFDLFGAKGGFIGVDVFFVLSGFLVTGIILKELGAAEEYSGQNSFSLAKFYTKRFWRLYPSSLFTSAWTLLASRFLFPKALSSAVAKSVLASMLLASNILFYSESGYWDADSLTKPLLHTWSLSVEEQFYLFWPCMLLLLSKALIWFPTKSSKKEFLVGFLGSFALCSFFGAWHIHVKDSSFAFFSLPARVYEFSLGGMCSPLYIYTSEWKGLAWEIASSLAMIIILGSFFVLKEATGRVFFGFHSLPVLLSTVTVIMLPNTHINSRILSHPWLRHVGKISYTLYLVHWPLWVFQVFQRDIMRRIHIDKVAFGVLAFGLTLILGQLQYILIESRYRFRGAIPTLAKLGMLFSILVLASSAAVLAFLPSMSSYVGPTENSSYSKSAETNQESLSSVTQITATAREVYPYKQDGLDAIHESTIQAPWKVCDYWRSSVVIGESRGSACILGDRNKPPSAVLIGDTMMWLLTNGFDYAGRKLGVSVLSFARGGCYTDSRWLEKLEPIPDNECGRVHSNISAALPSIPPGSTIFFSKFCYDWCARSGDCGSMADKDIAYFKSFGLDVVFIGMPPMAPFKPSDCPKPDSGPACKVLGPAGKHFEHNEWMRDYMETKLDVRYFDLYTWFHTGSGENNFTYFADLYLLYKSERELSEAGSLYVGPRIVELFKTYLVSARAPSHGVWINETRLPGEMNRVVPSSVSETQNSGPKLESASQDQGNTPALKPSSPRTIFQQTNLYYRPEGLMAVKESLPIKPVYKVCDASGDDIQLGGSRGASCLLGDRTKHPSAILIGDSMMYALSQGFHYACQKLGMSVLSFARAGCTPRAGWYDKTESVPDDHCGQNHNNVSAALGAVPTGTTVFFTAYCSDWCLQVETHGPVNCRDKAKKEMAYFKSFGYKIIYIGMPPWVPFAASFCPSPESGPACLRAGPTNRFYEHNEWMRSYVENELDTRFVELYPYLRAAPDVNNFTYFAEEYPLYKDHHHLSDYGAIYLGPLLIEMLKTSLTVSKKPWIGSLQNLSLEEPRLV